MEKNKEQQNQNHLELGKGIKFCLNCDDMDELALNDDSDDIDAARKRFQNCQKTGNFDGDVCSRMYVATEDNYSEEQFTDPEDEE